MNEDSKKIRNIYLFLVLVNTLASSFIWGINTLFLLDAGLNNMQAFSANALFTAGQVIFEVPTGIIADIWGRRTSYLLGTLTLAVSTILYWLSWQTQAPFWSWAITSILLGLGFTFFSGATEAWLVDALDYTDFKGDLDSVFAKGQMVGGTAMLSGAFAGGLIAQFTNLGVPYILRSVALLLTFIVAFFFMKDIGFTPEPSKNFIHDMKKTFRTSINVGWQQKPIRWLMLESLFSSGIGFYTFYAMQPYLLELYGDSQAYWVAGLAATIVGGAQIFGGMVVPHLRRFFNYRTSILLTITVLNVLLLICVALTSSFTVAIGLLVIWALLFAARMPIRQSYLNKQITSKQRATVLSFDSLFGSSGGVVIQPVLGKVADVWSYSTSYLIGSGFQLLALPFVFLAKREKVGADKIDTQ